MKPHQRSPKPAAAESHDEMLAKALRLREAIIQAVAWERRGALCHLARSLLAFTPTKGVLKASGLGKLVHDKQVWAAMDNQTDQPRRVQVEGLHQYRTRRSVPRRNQGSGTGLWWASAS